MHNAPSIVRLVSRVTFVSLALWTASCATTPAEPVIEPGTAYASPDAVVDATVAAIRSENRSELSKILGGDATEVLGSADEVADRNGIREFLRKYDEANRLVTRSDGSVILEVGQDNWPMAFPIVKSDDGWRLDTPAGIEEISARRIGRNELNCIQTCLAMADAQAEYRQVNPDGQTPPAFAARFISEPGTKNGLFWPAASDGSPSPLGSLAASASAEGYSLGTNNEPRPYYGYHFRMLSAQGPFAPGGRMNYRENGRMVRGFAVIAYPAEYGRSGIMSFMIAKQGIVYQCDMGPDTAAVARGMTEFNPDQAWLEVR